MTIGRAVATRRSGGALLLLAALVLWLPLALPQRPEEAGLAAILWLPPELVLVIALLLLAGRPLRGVVVVGLWLVMLQKIADLAMAPVLGRPFNAVADLVLIDAGVRLVAGSFGKMAAGALLLLAGLVLALMALALWWAAGRFVAQAADARLRAGAGLVALAVLALAWAGLWRMATAEHALWHLAQGRQTLAALTELKTAAARDDFASRDDLLTAIDRDVLVIFVESYGRQSFDMPFYAERHLPRLRQGEQTLAQAGLAMRSGFVTAPSQGGQSWLAHATFANGLWIDDQTRYRAVLASGRQTLFHHARRAGFTTATVVPAITMPWPESAVMGFDRVLAAADLGYRGQPFNWVTMPDQFTLAAMDRLLRSDPAGPRRMIEVALISSHAPWVPVPRLLPWDQIGDGREFDAMARAGDPPDVVWRDPERVKAQYRDALDYALQTVLDYAARQGADAPLILVLGDHPAAPPVAMDRRRQVPLHVIGPAPLVARSEGWGLAPGLIPPPGHAALPMQDLRDLILGSFTAGARP